jgi:hypothetical protein
MSVTDDLLREVAEAIIHNLDEDGLLRASLEEIASMGPYAPEEVERALGVVQGFDPPVSRRAISPNACASSCGFSVSRARRPT